jgi:UDP-N-acetyl-D-glucosamine dehydrogenase
VLGIAYKKNVDDVRESPSVEIMEQLRERGAVVNYCDPYFPSFPHMRHHQFDLHSLQLSEETLRQHDCVVIATDHDLFDYELIFKESALVVDTRGRAKQKNERIFPA